LDLATAGGYTSGTVSVLKNNGDGTFAEAQDFAAGVGPSAITLGDLDGDGDLDVATANLDSNDVSVLANSGDATFTTPQSFIVGGSPFSVTVGDLDRDGDLDLATANLLSDNVSVLQNLTPTLQLSRSANRSNPLPLAGKTVSGNIYVFASGKDTDFKRVQFYLDDPDRSSAPIRLERSAPFDFAGGTNMDPTVTQARPFDTRTLANGQHTITATFARTDGTFRTITSTFTVAN
ncbi:MAG: VCBS repeat-containing protein, partial [Gemmatimonadaceae bacterium]|nr:VCBS repeat-containing protein [Gloeobacterales cyanobacterium ES-bin-141]